MSRQIVFFFFLLVSIVLYANDGTDSRYLKGAVPEIDGKVVFSKSISVNNSLSDDKLFDLLNDWAMKNYSGEETKANRVVLSDSQKKNIACLGEKALVFKSSALSLDRAFMSYQLIIEVENHTSRVSLRNIKFLYNDGNKQELFSAEDMITDKVALNKQGSKLNRYYDKFRIHTIDSIGGLFNSIEKYLNENVSERTVVAENNNANVVILPQKNSREQASISGLVSSDNSSLLSGYKNINSDRIPGNIIKLLNDWTLIVSGNLNINTIVTSWGGLGVFADKPVAFNFVTSTKHSFEGMDQSETYSICFFTETYKEVLQYLKSRDELNNEDITSSGLTPIKLPSGTNAFSEAWMIIECKKTLVQPIVVDAVVDNELKEKWERNVHSKMYVGEILNVWVK